MRGYDGRGWGRQFEERRERTSALHPHFARYAAKNIRVALSTTSSMRLAEGAGAAWKTNGRNSVALHISMNCEAASWQSSIARSPGLTCTLRYSARRLMVFSST